MINRMVPYAELKLETRAFKNPRTSTGLDDDSLDELAINIGTNGLLVPLVVTETSVILAGQRRYLAIGRLLDVCASSTAVPSLRRHLLVLSQGELLRLRRFAEAYAVGIPVRVIAAQHVKHDQAIALVDNLARSDLSSFEVAQAIFNLSQHGMTGAEISRSIAKSPTYVSRKLSTWSGSCTELRVAWQAGELAEDAVQQLSELSADEQRKALSGPTPRAKRGPANRPGIDTVKDFLEAMEKRELTVDGSPTDRAYRAGVIDALRWITGQGTTMDFAKLAQEDN